LREMIQRHVAGQDEKMLLTGIAVPLPPEGTWGRFMKHGVRAAIDFATINVALRYSPAFPGRGEPATVKIFVGAISAEPVELNETAQFLVSNYSRHSSLQGEIEERARKEMAAKAALIREPGISPKSKRDAFDLTSQVIGELLVFPATA
jgi:hypothetical protein